MVTSSFTYLIFLLCIALLYWKVSLRRYQNVLLLSASLIFYAWWDWRFCGLLLFSAAVDFVCGRKINDSSSQPKRRKWLLISLGINLGLLIYFKYCGFFIDSAIDAMHAVGIEANRPVLQIILPLGISFYTFQTLSYTIDIYRRQLKPTDDFISYACFVCFFPQLVAGPIERASHLLPQFTSSREFDFQKTISGLRLILWGLFKKICVGDSIAKFADFAFTPGSAISPSIVIFSTVCFAIQIYADFSGYTDIARGSARLLGFELVKNFRLPWLATSPTDFWRRWHISLSSWFRDYLYIPLGGNRHGKVRQGLAILITFFLSGLWHGAGWNFLIWGIIHGLFVCIAFSTHRSKVTRWRKIVGWVATTIAVVFLWIFFRAESLQQAATLFSEAASFRPTLDELGWLLDWLIESQATAGVFLAAVLMILSETTTAECDSPFDAVGNPAIRWVCYTLVIWWVLGSSSTAVLQPYIYFNF